MRFSPRRNAKLREEGNAEALRGKDGWLFLQGDTNDVLGQHTGRIVPDRRWAREWRRLWRRRARLMRRVGAAHLQAIVPDKEAVYADKLPDSVVLANRRTVHAVLEKAPRYGIEVSYPLDALRATGAEVDVFSRADTHWTGPGAYVAYRAICAALTAHGIEIPVVGEDDIEWEEEEVVGDLGSKLDPPESSVAISPRLRGQRARRVEDNLVRVTGRRIVFESDQLGAPSWLVFGTSYAVKALPFLAESARRLVFIHTTAMVHELVEEERPDIVLVLTAERGLIRPPVDQGAGEELAAVTARKLEAGLVWDDED